MFLKLIWANPPVECFSLSIYLALFPPYVSAIHVKRWGGQCRGVGGLLGVLANQRRALQQQYKYPRESVKAQRPSSELLTARTQLFWPTKHSNWIINCSNTSNEDRSELVDIKIFFPAFGIQRENNPQNASYTEHVHHRGVLNFRVPVWSGYQNSSDWWKWRWKNW